jgi:hypothetical protein
MSGSRVALREPNNPIEVTTTNLPGYYCLNMNATMVAEIGGSDCLPALPVNKQAAGRDTSVQTNN